MKFLRAVYVSVIVLCAVSAATAQVDYATKIQPIFDAHCIGCHATVRSGVTLASYATVMASVGTQYATKVVVPGSSSTSPLYDKISNAVPQKGLRMPRNNTPLSDAEILLIKNWIDQGAIANAPTSVLGQNGAVPATYELSQNYPNPFNPATQISFSLPAAQFVSLVVFDITGRQVASLVNSVVQPGSYAVEWNAANVPSGMYFYQLRAGASSPAAGQAFTSTKKMILQK